MSDRERLERACTAPLYEHTPGPWIARYRESGATNIYQGETTTLANLVATAFRPRSLSDDEKTANARLIAAAPEMLAALKESMAYLRDVAPMLESHDEHHVSEMAAKQESIIAKAEGN